LLAPIPEIGYVGEVEPLHAVEIRVLGSLLEKDIATPEYYPLTVNALMNACNQKSSREPVVSFDDSTVEHALELLRSKGLALRVSGAGHRVEKWGHRLGEWNMGRRELAVLCVLMLRGPQTVGELRGRTDRMHTFEDLDEVERVLTALAGRTAPLVAPAGRGRWSHLLGDGVEVVAEEESPAARASLADRVEALERELEEIKMVIAALQRR
jgi:uncharacterized protein YceH (UPF0502 family)